MNAAVITFPGSNCDDDLNFALRIAGFQVTQLWHKDHPDLSQFGLVALPGGFSYGDYLRCGAMAALSPIMDDVRTYAEKGGFVLGLCNGFQILCETGLLPGALARNLSLNFVCKDVLLKIKTNQSPWTCKAKAGELLSIPIAHGDGRYVVDESTYKQLVEANQVLLTYTDATGEENTESNPNGSHHNIAGICNQNKNVFGLMPHPERATDLRSRNGMIFWQSILHALSEKKA
ncbi:MAG: phosphoribosylformylglycinamidine synthase I [Deltaproteobacteria bacterium]|nr:phosphoribosylformylglycinamidine synthase I [Deltaproteobacteria bacterium]